jgi:bifunctional ADP-heptose synthase (sugar kinase/adenylyltransferase)
MVTHFELLKKKICSLTEVKIICDNLRKEKKTIVFTNGCFDLIHLGHIDYLSKASDLGDILII